MTNQPIQFPAECTRELDVEPTGAPDEDICMGKVDSSTGRCRTCGKDYTPIQPGDTAAQDAEAGDEADQRWFDKTDGYDRAISVLHGVWARSGSEAAGWAANYLRRDPDRWRGAERCWHSAECSGGGPDCAPYVPEADQPGDGGTGRVER